jgi:hypothetical protein
VENSWPCVTGGPSGRDDLSKSRRDLLRGLAKHAVTCGASASPARDEEIRAADHMLGFVRFRCEKAAIVLDVQAGHSPVHVVPRYSADPEPAACSDVVIVAI